MTVAPATLLISGVVWIVMYVASFVALGSSVPTIESSGQEIVAWFTDNGINARIYAWTAAFAAVSLTIFGGMVATLLPKPHRYIFIGGILMWVITGLVQGWFWAGLALRPEGLDPTTARTLFDIPQYWGPLINASTMTMGLAVAALGFGATRIVPRWLAWLSVVLVAEQAVETITVFGESGFIAPGGPMNIYLGGVVGMAWVIGILYWSYGQWKSLAVGAAAATS